MSLIRSIRKRSFQVGVFLLGVATILLLSSGDLSWTAAWLYWAILVAVVGTTAVVLICTNPGLIQTRAEKTKDPQDWDRIVARLVALFAWVGTLTIAGLDHRFDWTEEFPTFLQVAAVGLAICGQTVKIWAMASNPFFTALVGIQKEQMVCNRGPYQFIRHPGHAGMLVFILMTPLILGSLWALLPAVGSVCLLILRIAWEDKILKRDLEGFSDYCYRVPYRLIPGFW
jgi:protein-S-isoprenylcysteine O-methyltransferase Ste14